MNLVLVILILILIYVSILKYPKVVNSFMILLLTDTGGYFGTYFSKGIFTFGGLFYADFFFFLLFFLVLVQKKLKIGSFFLNPDAKKVFFILLVFLIYKLIIFGYLISGISDDEYLRYFIIRERYNIFSFLIIIPAYLFAMQDLEIFFKILIITGTVIALFFIITVITGIELIPVKGGFRYYGESIQRYYLQNRGLLYLLIPAAFAVYITKIKIGFRKLLLFGGVCSIVVAAVSLTKGVYILVLFMIISSLYIVNKLLDLKISRLYIRTVFILAVTFLLITTFLPEYTENIFRGFGDLYSLVTGGNYETREEGRMINQLPAQTLMISQRPFLGTGYGFANLSNQFNLSDYDVTDLSILGHIMQYGILGFSIYCFFYYRLILIIKNNYRTIKKIPKNKLLDKFKYELIFTVITASYFIGYFSRFFNVSIELTNDMEAFNFYVMTGLLLATYQRILNKFNYINAK